MPPADGNTLVGEGSSQGCGTDQRADAQVAPSHTPGEWCAGEDRAGVVGIYAGSITVAHVYGGIGPQEHAANVHLITAAPDLLEALRDLRSATPGTATLKAARAKADAAITKATGGNDNG